MRIIGFDPGRDKCGLALVEQTGTIIEHQVVTSEQALMMIRQWCEEASIQKLVMGNQTTSQQWREKVQAEIPHLGIMMVDERNSTLEARDRYWELYPPQGLMYFIPKGMRIPPRPIDDIVAILLVERSKLTSDKPTLNS
ncbi:MAG: pre-16S rRNA-processing nuclease YqgF [Halothece sp. Uz-M2-17]|nr:pre-16S rRNA-processing nuclease YqgF [Halothece sp. Uz-M2-17]